MPAPLMPHDSTNTVGQFADVNGLAVPGHEDAAGNIEVETASVRNAGALHRNAITAADTLALPGTLTLSAITEAGSTLAAVANYAGVSAGNVYGPTGPGPIPASITPAANQAVRMAWAQVAGSTYYDLFLSGAAAPLWVGRVTEAQRVAGGLIISAVGVVSAGASPAGSIDIGVVGTGVATNAVPFTVNNALLPANATATAVNCAGFSRAHAHIALAVTDLRSAPALTVVPMLQDELDSTWYAGQPLTLGLTASAGEPLQQDLQIDVDGATGLILLIASISGQGAAATVRIECA